jgi:hypothetical protein
MEDETEVGYYLGRCPYCFRYVMTPITHKKILTSSIAIPLRNRIRTNFHRSPPRRNWCTRSNHAISPHSMSIRRYTPIPSKRSNAPKSSTHVRKPTTATAAANETTTKSTGLQTTTKWRWNETSSNGFRSSPRWTRWTRTTRWNATTSTSNSICPKSSHFHIR